MLLQVNVTETVYRNYQKITLQESPGSVQAGRLPRHREVVLLHDLIDCARPGEEIQVTGETCPQRHMHALKSKDRAAGSSMSLLHTKQQRRNHRHAGVYTNTYDASLNVKNGFPVFSTLVEANHIQVCTTSSPACSSAAWHSMRVFCLCVLFNDTV